MGTQSGREKWERVWLAIIWLGLVVAFAFSLLATLLPRSFVGDTLANFRLQYCFGFFVLLLLGAKSRSLLFALLAVVGLVLNTAILIPYYPRSEVTEDRNGVKIMSANIYRLNTEHAEFEKIVRSEAPEILVVVEFDVIWARGLRGLDDLYPYRLKIPRDNNFGLAIYSKYELSDGITSPLKPGQPPTISTKVKIGDNSITLIATHPVPPRGATGFELRNAQLQSLAERVRQSGDEVLLMGDLNTTPWSAFFQEFLAESGLVNSRHGAGTVVTWPSYFPLMHIPIDHCLGTAKLRVSGLHSVLIPGSDHRGLIGYLSFRN